MCCTTRRRHRKALAAVEVAVVFPLIVVLLLGAMELGRAMMVQHALESAARGGCRVYSVRESSVADAQQVIDAAMSQAGISGYTVTFNPTTKEQIDVPLEPVSVTVSISFGSMALVTPDYLAGGTLKGQCTMPADMQDAGPTDPSYDVLDDDNGFDGIPRHDGDDDGGDDDEEDD